jgi:hypothetical protein
MARKVRIAAICGVIASTLLVALLGGAYYAAQQVRPFYEQALKIEPDELERGRRELESRATALYSDAKQTGRWQALFTTDQINGWLATQLTQNSGTELPANFRDPRVAIAHDVLTLGFRTSSGGVETVISVDAGVSLTDDGAVAVELISVKAGALPLPVLQLADQLADACKKMKLPVRWTRNGGKPVALVEIRSKEPVFIDAIQLDDDQLYVAGHTENGRDGATASKSGPKLQVSGGDESGSIDEFELKLTPKDESSALEIARRPREAK